MAKLVQTAAHAQAVTEAVVFTPKGPMLAKVCAMELESAKVADGETEMLPESAVHCTGMPTADAALSESKTCGSQST
jgi:hypothetical protein